MVETNKLNWPVALCVVAVILLLSQVIAVGIIISDNNKNVDRPVNIDLTSITSSIDELSTKVDGLASTSATKNSRLDSAVNEVLKSDDEEKIAKDLAISYIDCKEFKKALKSYLNTLDENGIDLNIESYKDISSIVVKDVDVDLEDDDKATVIFTLKIIYFNDGDNDASDAQTAKVKVTLLVEELDEDEDYADAEVIEPVDADFELVKFYSD